MPFSGTFVRTEIVFQILGAQKKARAELTSDKARKAF